MTGRISQDPRMPRIGYLVAERYQISEILGEGGFAAVYLARDVRAGGQVALKVLDPEQSDDPTSVDRFRQEVAVVRELSHHNTVKIWDVGTTDNGCVFYVMELVRGEELSRLIGREGPLPTERALRILGQVLASLSEAHARGVVHRDLKPKNIMVAQTPMEPDYVKVLDFGIAKALAPELAMAKTQTGMMLATPAYAAPELLRASGIQPATDLYAVGLILIELLTGRPAVQGDSLADLIAQQMMPGPVALPPELATHPLRPVIEKATIKDVTARYQTAEAMLEDLRRYSGVSTSGLGPAQLSRAGRGGSRSLLLGSALIALSVVAGGVFVVLYSGGDGGEGGGSGRSLASLGDPDAPPADRDTGAHDPLGTVPTTTTPDANTGADAALGLTVNLPDLDGAVASDSGSVALADGPPQNERPQTDPSLVRIEAGSFSMGSPRAEPFHQADEPLRSVTLSRAFLMGSHEVTQAEFQSLMGRNPSSHVACGPTCPVDSVSWFDAVAYTNARSRSEGLSPCYSWSSERGTPGTGCYSTTAYGGWGCDGDYVIDGLVFAGLECPGYRLPTEAEWEYAARAGTAQATYNGNPTQLEGGPDPVLTPIAWYMENSGNVPHPVGLLQPNPWGLYDVYGNIWEWTNDWYGPYAAGAAWDPTGPVNGLHPAIRGSGYNGTTRTIRAANRYDDVEGVPPVYRGIDTGFRLVRTAR